MGYCISATWQLIATLAVPRTEVSKPSDKVSTGKSVLSVARRPDGKLLPCGCMDDTISVFDVARAKRENLAGRSHVWPCKLTRGVAFRPLGGAGVREGRLELRSRSFPPNSKSSHLFQVPFPCVRPLQELARLLLQHQGPLFFMVANAVTFPHGGRYCLRVSPSPLSLANPSKTRPSVYTALCSFLFNASLFPTKPAYVHFPPFPFKLATIPPSRVGI
ncbi:hypothetical protein H6P81_014365 [Aristolochia fimbriata]|uniref:Uncharacterized protein n=1 Tax=Aristolochia fimbriata TaxID=158543 RepID=A0AAV7EHD1_ARIFI|nr:hypothetical protein H6P81_014365 [Aristolochia fimbriata]